MLSQYTWKNGPEAIAQHNLARHEFRALGQIGDFARWRWSCDHS